MFQEEDVEEEERKKGVNEKLETNVKIEGTMDVLLQYQSPPSSDFKRMLGSLVRGLQRGVSHLVLSLQP